MEHLIFFGAGIAAIAGAMLSKLLADEFKAWRPSLVAALIAAAVRRLPPAMRQRSAEEWESHVNDVPGDIGKVTAACGKLVAAWKIAEGPFGARKRLFDLGFALGSIFLTGPLFAFLIVVVKLSSSGPVFVRHPSVGRHGRRFTVLKFRSRASDADACLLAYLETNPDALEEWHATGKLRFDPRLTSLGVILERTSLVELPSLFSVLTGNMTVVGPPPLDEASHSGADNPYLACKPGFLGSGERRDDLWSLSRDLKIVVSALHDVLLRDRFPNSLAAPFWIKLLRVSAFG